MTTTIGRPNDIPLPPAAVDEVRIVTWNVQHASAARRASQLGWLAEQAPDVVVLTEVGRGPAGAGYAEALADGGYATVAYGSDDYGTVVAARGGRLYPLVEQQVPDLWHRFVIAGLDLDDGRRLGIAGLYVPSRGPRQYRNLAKRACQNAVTAALPRLPTAFGAGVPVVFAGDLNVVEPNHQPRLPVFGLWEYDFYRAFAAAGFTDAFRHLHPDTVDHSWYGRAGVGYRIDHLFVTTGHSRLLTDCRYLHEPRQAGLSDHSALAAILAHPRPGPPGT